MEDRIILGAGVLALTPLVFISYLYLRFFRSWRQVEGIYQTDLESIQIRKKRIIFVSRFSFHDELLNHYFGRLFQLDGGFLLCPVFPSLKPVFVSHADVAISRYCTGHKRFHTLDNPRLFLVVEDKIGAEQGSDGNPDTVVS